MKKHFILAVLAVITSTLAACGAENKVGEAVNEVVTEIPNILDEAINSDDVNIIISPTCEPTAYVTPTLTSTPTPSHRPTATSTPTPTPTIIEEFIADAVTDNIYEVIDTVEVRYDILDSEVSLNQRVAEAYSYVREPSQYYIKWNSSAMDVSEECRIDSIKDVWDIYVLPESVLNSTELHPVSEDFNYSYLRLIEDSMTFREPFNIENYPDGTTFDSDDYELSGKIIEKINVYIPGYDVPLEFEQEKLRVEEVEHRKLISNYWLRFMSEHLVLFNDVTTGHKLYDENGNCYDILASGLMEDLTDIGGSRKYTVKCFYAKVGKDVIVLDCLNDADWNEKVNTKQENDYCFNKSDSDLTKQLNIIIYNILKNSVALETEEDTAKIEKYERWLIDDADKFKSIAGLYYTLDEQKELLTINEYDRMSIEERELMLKYFFAECFGVDYVGEATYDMKLIKEVLGTRYKYIMRWVNEYRYYNRVTTMEDIEKAARKYAGDLYDSMPRRIITDIKEMTFDSVETYMDFKIALRDELVAREESTIFTDTYSKLGDLELNLRQLSENIVLKIR